MSAESTKRVSLRIKSKPPMSKPGGLAPKPAASTARVTRATGKQQVANDMAQAHQDIIVTASSTEGHALLATEDQPVAQVRTFSDLSSRATTPPLSEDVDLGDAQQKKRDLSAALENLDEVVASMDQDLRELEEVIGANPAPVPEEEDILDASEGSSDAYIEGDESATFSPQQAEKKAILVKPIAPKATAGARKAAKVITLKDIAATIGDLTIAASVKKKPFNEPLELDSSLEFYDVRDKVAEILDRRARDLVLGYTCSWWSAVDKKSPCALRDNAMWENLVQSIKIWLAGDKRRAGTLWGITIMDQEDAEGSGKAVKGTSEKKAPKPNKAEAPPPDSNLTNYTELKRKKACQIHGNRACWVVPPQYFDLAGSHLPLGEGILQMWADAISQPSSGTTTENPGKHLGDKIIERRQEIDQEKATLKAIKQRRKSLQKSLATPSHFSRNPFRTPTRPIANALFTPSTGKRDADEAALDDPSNIETSYPSVEEWLSQLDRTQGRRMQGFSFLSLHEKLMAEEITDLEVLNELGRDGLKNDIGLALGHAVKLAKWAAEDVSKLQAQSN